MRKIVASCVALLAIGCFGAAAAAQTVTVTGGEIRGAMLEKGGAVFKGIPYAAPPVGDLRWREPMPVKPWIGVREATAFGAICPQLSGLANTQTVSEDCLFLNIWTPEWPSTSRKPVMVWIHGGGNFQGSGAQPYIDGESLIRHGVVLVSINYRLGSFGFFSHPELTRESPHHASGNQGLLDQIAALKWVRENIARFGGDPENVTIFGSSAGSVNAGVLMTSPLSKGLFHRVIGESGPAILIGDPLPLPQAEARGSRLAARWPVSADASVREFRAIPMADILKADPDWFIALPPNLGITVDGYVFEKKPAEVFAASQQHDVGLLLGSNAREIIPGTSVPSNLQNTIDNEYGPLVRDRAKSLYVGGTDPVYGSAAAQWATDISFRCSSVTQLVWHVAAGRPAFQFELVHVPLGREASGATHAAELSYVFGTLDRGIVASEGLAIVRTPATAVDEQVSAVIQQYWTNFAKTGDPNGAGLPSWPRFDSTTRAYIQFTGNGPIAKEGLRRPYCDLFMENVNRQTVR